jgi:hypothetical protein
MHQDKLFTNYFIKGFPLYVCRQFSHCRLQGGHLGSYIDQCTYVNLYWHKYIGLCTNLNDPPEDGNVKIAEIRIGEIL